MINKGLRRLSRNDLVTLMLAQAKEIEQLWNQLSQAQQELADRLHRGNFPAQLSGVFQDAHETCALYAYNLEELSRLQEVQCAWMEQERHTHDEFCFI